MFHVKRESLCQRGSAVASPDDFNIALTACSRNVSRETCAEFVLGSSQNQDFTDESFLTDCLPGCRRPLILGMFQLLQIVLQLILGQISRDYLVPRQGNCVFELTKFDD